ncbi:MAG: hypothetical protein ABR987_06965 [Terracidiphilus sp.]|jgi:hypothetical protein
MTGNRVLLVAALAALLVTSAVAQKNEVTPTAADRLAVKSAQGGVIHPLLANTKAAGTYGKEATAGPAVTGPAITPFPKGRRYPGDLTYQGGETVDRARYHAIYVLNSFTGTTGCTQATIPTCWGSPEDFLKNLGKSDFIHVVDQYVGRYDRDRYTNGADAFATFTPLPPALTDADMQALVHAVAASLGFPTGYGNIYHIFLPPGTDECFDATYATCYSPDNPATFFFCAYHGSVTFTDVGHVLYTVEPYQNVSGCNVPPGSPNGPLVDATNSVLSHETFETITDPDGTAWWNGASNALYGSEIADECEFIIFYPTAVYFNPSIWHVDGHVYATQPEYNNDGHTCSTSPDWDDWL